MSHELLHNLSFKLAYHKRATGLAKLKSKQPGKRRPSIVVTTVHTNILVAIVFYMSKPDPMAPKDGPLIWNRSEPIITPL